MQNSFVLILIIVPSLMPSISCMKDQLDGLVSVEGTVLYGSEPVADALVSFSPMMTNSGLRSASAMTDPNGRFNMTTRYRNDGVMPGEYKVAIRKMQEKSTNEVKSHLPSKYASVEESGLSITVTPKGNRVVRFTLSD